MLQEQREKHEAESASRLQKQAKGIQTQLVLHYYDIYEKYHGIIMFLSIGNTLALTCSLGMLHISCTHVI